MKKVFVLIAVMLVAAGVMAQDTIHTRTPKSNYFYTNWLDTTINHCTLTRLGGYSPGGLLRGKRFFHSSKDSLKIAGIAVSLATPLHGRTWNSSDSADNSYNMQLQSQIIDTSLDNAYEFLSIYRYDSSIAEYIPVSDSLCVHFRDSLPAYYMDLDMHDGFDNSIFWVDPIPVHEIFFAEPVSVIDSFFIFMTQRSFNFSGGYYSHLPINLTMLSNGDLGYDHYLCLGPYGWIRRTMWDIVFIFPILYISDPEPPTPPTDSVAIVPPETMEAMVEVAPNPTNDRILVTSTARLERLEIYNNTGTLLLERQASGTSAEIDVITLPAGIYVLKAYTSTGNINKKVVIKH